MPYQQKAYKDQTTRPGIFYGFTISFKRRVTIKRARRAFYMGNYWSFFQWFSQQTSKQYAAHCRDSGLERLMVAD